MGGIFLANRKKKNYWLSLSLSEKLSRDKKERKALESNSKHSLSEVKSTRSTEMRWKLLTVSQEPKGLNNNGGKKTLISFH